MYTIDFWKDLNGYFIPQGYKLVEDKAHEIARLESEISEERQLIRIYEKEMAAYHLSVENKQKRIDELKAGE